MTLFNDSWSTTAPKHCRVTQARAELESGPVHYEELTPAGLQAEGPAIVFVHGAWVDGSLWAETAGALARRHRCIVPTWPLGSHTEPMEAEADLSPFGVAALVAEFLETLELDEVTLVGNDTGGAICQMVATRHAQRIARLVLTNCDGFEVFPPKAYKHLTLLPRVPGLLAAAAMDMYALPTLARLPGTFGPLTAGRIPTGMLRQWLRPAAKSSAIRRDLSKLLKSVHASQTLEVARELASFQGKALLVWGAEDRYFTVELARRLEKAFADAELELIPEAKTYVSLDRPEIVAESISRFHRSAPARDAAPRERIPA